MKLCAWNICGLKNKLQNNELLNFFLGYDIIWITEIGGTLVKSIPGFDIYVNKSKQNDHRGGIMMLVKCSLAPFVTKVNMLIEGQIWMELSCCAGVRYGGVYIPPDDSPYYDPALLGALESQVKGYDRVIVMGDLNARVGHLPNGSIEGKTYEYCQVMDFTVNNRGRMVTNMCNGNDMVVANHLRFQNKQLGGNLSFRRREWISEIDLCLVKYKCIDMLEDLQIQQDIEGSDHAPITVTLDLDGIIRIVPSELLECASNLGKSYYRTQDNSHMSKGPHHSSVELELFKMKLTQLEPPPLGAVNEESVERVIRESCKTINNVARECKRPNPHREYGNNLQPRWKRIMDEKDSKLIWQAIGWKGEIFDNSENTQPSDDEFKLHFEQLLNPGGDSVEVPNIDEAPYIPVLDDPFSALELEQAIKAINIQKSFVGISPGLLTHLPITWFSFLLTLLNAVFQCFCYPLGWCYSKLIVLFKSGNRMLCDNYRGISIMDTLSKLYDTLIMNRLKLWVSIDKCQAGAMKKRGCLEQILALRLLCDYAKHMKVTLYVLFIDYRKAYDKVPRHKLVEYLRSIGCGRIMLKAIQNMYRCTRNILMSATVESSVGVRQGAPSSCLLFVVYIDKMIRMIKGAVAVDGFLGALHALLLMDDTVILATSRDMCIKKMNVVVDYCREYGMVLNESKTKFFVINNSNVDKIPLNVQGHVINYCPQYLYLGAWFTDTGNMKDVMKLHEARNQSVVNKFAIFCASNTDMPYCYKRKVFDAAVLSALTYSCESWLIDNCNCLTSQYNKLVKCLLGVRKNTCINLCYIESGIKPVSYIVSVNRKRFMESKLAFPDMEEPFHLVLELCRSVNTPGYMFLRRALQFDCDVNPLEKIKESARNKPESATKYYTYKSVLNTGMSVHEIYLGNQYIPDYMRQSFSRVRLMSHDLKIETGRWSRTPREMRRCHCNGLNVQTEEHVLVNCVITRELRIRYGLNNIQNLDSLFKLSEIINVCRYIHEALRIIRNN